MGDTPEAPTATAGGGMNRRRFLALSGGVAATTTLAACSTDTPNGDADRPRIDDLRSAIRGRVLLPGDEGFQNAHLPWNLAIEQPIAAVAEVLDAADAAAAVRFARRANLSVAVQPHGHGASDNLRGTILLRTTRLDEIRIEPATRSARVGAGVSWDQVMAQTAENNLIGLAGSSPAVSVTGYILGGGLSWFSRMHGWAADSVTAFDTIDADGRPTRVTVNSDPDLFWALRGGGGDFALVTATEFRLHPATTIYGGRMLWPARSAPEILEAFRDITATAPDELTLWCNLFQPPDGQPIVGIDMTYLGDAATGQALVHKFDTINGRIRDTRRVLPPTELGSIAAEPTTPNPGQNHAQFLTAINDDVITALLEKPITPLRGVHIRHLGGALSRTSNSSASNLTEPYFINLQGTPSTPQTRAALTDRMNDYRRALRPHLSTRTPFTFLSPHQTAADAFTHATLTRLRTTKQQHDPQRLFRSNYPVLP
ncbi:FAD-binding oxidoreductase [Nocardia sp. NBC_01009]|uniref:FAD-binding oxidoreductase n=1 Tax=Nocardia sp. NBC_01009 TaxID=2975996 RepID=UPI00386D0A39|nr:FAD-binding protein [Nocardia sp. NBC_01009]